MHFYVQVKRMWLSFVCVCETTNGYIVQEGCAVLEFSSLDMAVIRRKVLHLPSYLN